MSAFGVRSRYAAESAFPFPAKVLVYPAFVDIHPLFSGYFLQPPRIFSAFFSAGMPTANGCRELAGGGVLRFH
jgi:hypothetical protein